VGIDHGRLQTGVPQTATNIQMRAHAKKAGARWDPEKKLWFVKYGQIAGTQLEKHIQVDSG